MKEHWPRLSKAEVTCRGGSAYVTTALTGDEPQFLSRLLNPGP